MIQTPIDKGKNKQAIAFPFRPGDSGVRISYKVPYAGQSDEADASFRRTPADRVGIFAPPDGAGFGRRIFSPPARSRDSTSTCAIGGREHAVYGVAFPAPLRRRLRSGRSRAGRRFAESIGEFRPIPAERRATATATTLPARLDSLKWILVAGFAAMFALGLDLPAGGARKWSRDTAVADASTPAVRGRSAAAQSADDAVADVNREVRGSLDELKDTLFRLELRRQAGTITEEDYAREHARIQKLLRDLVKG